MLHKIEAIIIFRCKSVNSIYRAYVLHFPKKVKIKKICILKTIFDILYHTEIDWEDYK